MSRVSVIIPVYNGERYLAEAIESVLDQSHRAFELIVIDDGSSDGSAEVARRYDLVRYFHQQNQGISAARNRGVELARGDLLAFLDADDVWVAEKLELQVSAIQRDPELDMVFGHAQEFLTPELAESLKDKMRPSPRAVPGYLPSALLVKRDPFLRVGSFETNWKMGEFASWYVRALEVGLRHLMLPDLVVRRRLHDANNGLRQRQSITDYVRILKASLDRRRANEEGAGEPS